MIVEDLKKSIIHTAIRGKLVSHIDNDVYIFGDKKNEYKNSGIRIKKEKSLEELKFEIPDNWKWVRLEDVASIYGRIGFRGYTTSDLVAEGDGAITLSPGNIIDGKMDYSTCSYISWEKYDESPEIQIENGDILLVKTGSSYGKNAIVENLPEKATINPQYVVLKDIICNVNYLYYALNSDLSKQQYERFVIGTSIPTFSQAKLNSLLIPLPPIEEQQRIVNVIEELFSKLDEIKPIEDELNNLKKEFPKKIRNSIYQAAMTGELSIQNLNESSIKFLEKLEAAQKENNFKKMKDIIPVSSETIPYQLPDNWTWKKIGDLVEINLGFTYRPTYVENGYMFLSVKDISSGYIDFSDVKFISEEEYRKASYGSKPKKGDILFGRVGTIGVPQIVETDEPFCIFVSLGFFRDYTNMLNKKYLCYWMYSSLFKKQVADNVSGTAQINLNSNWLKNFYIPIPPNEEQQRIVDKIEQLLPLCDDIDNLVNE